MFNWSPSAVAYVPDRRCRSEPSALTIGQAPGTCGEFLHSLVDRYATATLRRTAWTGLAEPERHSKIARGLARLERPFSRQSGYEVAIESHLPH